MSSELCVLFRCTVPVRSRTFGRTDPRYGLIFALCREATECAFVTSKTCSRYSCVPYHPAIGSYSSRRRRLQIGGGAN